MRLNDTILGESVKKRNDKLYKVMSVIATLELGFSHNSIDAFGDAYEYLIGMYAAAAGKSGGEYFAPQEVSHFMAQVVFYERKKANKVYDITCGSGSLVLQCERIGKDRILKGFYGQEINPTSYNLCRMNMILHEYQFYKF